MSILKFLPLLIIISVTMNAQQSTEVSIKYGRAVKIFAEESQFLAQPGLSNDFEITMTSNFSKRFALTGSIGISRMLVVDDRYYYLAEGICYCTRVRDDRGFFDFGQDVLSPNYDSRKNKNYLTLGFQGRVLLFKAGPVYNYLSTGVFAKYNTEYQPSRRPFEEESNKVHSTYLLGQNANFTTQIKLATHWAVAVSYGMEYYHQAFWSLENTYRQQLSTALVFSW